MNIRIARIFGRQVLGRGIVEYTLAIEDGQRITGRRMITLDNAATLLPLITQLRTCPSGSNRPTLNALAAVRSLLLPPDRVAEASGLQE